MASRISLERDSFALVELLDMIRKCLAGEGNETGADGLCIAIVVFGDV